MVRIGTFTLYLTFFADYAHSSLGRLFDSLGSNHSATTKKQPKKSDTSAAAIQTDAPSARSPDAPANHILSSEPNINFKVHQFLWGQMVAIKEQVQMLGQENDTTEDDESLPDVYKDLSRFHFVLSNVRPILDAVITVFRAQGRKTTQFEAHLSDVTGTLLAVESRMQEVLDLLSKINGSIGPIPNSSYDTINKELKDQIEKLPHLQLDRQQLLEDFDESQESVFVREERWQTAGKISEDEAALAKVLDNLRSRMRQLQFDPSEPHSLIHPTRETTEEVSETSLVQRPLLLEERAEVESPKKIGTRHNPISVDEGDKKIAPRSTRSVEVAATADFQLVSSPPPKDSPPHIFKSPRRSKDPHKSPSISSSTPVSVPEDEDGIVVRDPQSPPPAIKKSPDHMVVGLWEGVTSVGIFTSSFA